MHILKERTVDGKYNYSQARVYLFLSVIYFFIIMTIITLKALVPKMTVELELIKSIMEMLTFPITLFSGYAFAAKGAKLIKEKIRDFKQPSNEKE